jgi:hypothetical protein
MTAAYHQERKHEGKWDVCQRPRCQNARLAIEGRGPFAALTPSLDTPPDVLAEVRAKVERIPGVDLTATIPGKRRAYVNRDAVLAILDRAAP